MFEMFLIVCFFYLTYRVSNDYEKVKDDKILNIACKVTIFFGSITILSLIFYLITGIR